MSKANILKGGIAGIILFLTFQTVRKATTSMFLFSLAIADNIMLWTGLFVFWMEYLEVLNRGQSRVICL